MTAVIPLLLAVLVILSVVSCHADDTTELDLPKDFFPIMPWDSLSGWGKMPPGHENVLENIAECGFTMSGFAMPEDLPKIEKLGLKAIMHPPTGDEPWKKKWIGVSEEAIEESVKRWVESCGDSKAIVAYHINDEPGTSKFPALAAAVAAVKKYAPGKLAYINLFPGYATIGAPDQSQLGAASYEDYLEQFVKVVKPQVLSYDDYQVQYSDDFQKLDRAAIYFRDLLDVRRAAQKHGIPFWNTVSSNQIRPHTSMPSPANLLLQAYTTLAAGGRGLAWYTFYEHGYHYAPIDSAGRRTETWHYLKMVNGQIKTIGPIMNRLTSTGVYFSKPWPTDEFPQLPGRIVEKVTSRSSVRGYSDFEPPLMIGEFKGEDGGDYVMVVNLSLDRSANFLLHTLKDYARKEVYSAYDGGLAPLGEENGHWLVAGGGALIKMSYNEVAGREAQPG